MRNGRVDKTGQERRVDKVRNELSSLSDGAAGDSRRGYSESPLVEEETKVGAGAFGIRAQGEIAMVAADEAVGRCSEGECESEEIVRDGSSGRVEDVGEHDVHSVLGSD